MTLDSPEQTQQPQRETIPQSIITQVADRESKPRNQTEHGNESARAKLDAIRVEREAIFEKHGIDEELCEREGINFKH